jgi:hypothetical protein
LHLVNGAAMFQNLLKKFCFSLRASRKSALRPDIFAANHFVHIRTPSLTLRIIIIFQDSRILQLIAIKRLEIFDLMPFVSQRLARKEKMHYNFIKKGGRRKLTPRHIDRLTDGNFL